MRGYFAIGIQNNKTPANLGTLWRTAHVLGAAFIFTIGTRYKHQPADVYRTPRHIPLYRYDTVDEFIAARPVDCPIVGVELRLESVPLPLVKHPTRAIYVLGPEDQSISPALRRHLDFIVDIPQPGMPEGCLNVAVAGSIVLYDRVAKANKE